MVAETPSETQQTQQKAAGRPLWCYIVIAVVVGIVTFVVGILIGRFALCPDEDNQPNVNPVLPKYVYEEDPNVADLLIQTIDNNKISEYLQKLTVKPHIAGSQEDFDLVSMIKTDMLQFGLDSVKAAPYMVLLSYPDTDRPNSVQLLNSTASNALIFDSRSQESNISNLPGVVPPFHAYSPASEITGDLIYVNYGRVEDYAFLASNASINVTGKIVLARYGKLFRGSKVQIAERNKAKGIIIYSDPADYTWPQEDSRVFPDTVYLPPTAVQRGTIFTEDGDPLTPGLPSTRTAYRLDENDPKVPLPGIPSHPIGYGAAIHFLQQLGGQEVPESWRGGMNITYKFGPLLPGNTVRMNITTKNSVRLVQNVIGIIKGEVEPDRYVMMGNHRDAWVYGALDPSSGTAVMMEVARAMGQLVKQGKWRPRRSIMFCSWGAEEYGLIGSTEWTEQYVKSLSSRAVAYVNIDTAVAGNYSLSAAATPLMHSAAFSATKKVPNPKVNDPNDTRTSVFDVWKDSYPSTENKNLPDIGSLGSGSDFAPMLQKAGITSLDMYFGYNKNKYKINGYPLYHTEYETFDTMQRLYDREFKCHQALARVAGEVLRNIADSLIIPFNVSNYVHGLRLIRQQLHTDYGQLLQQHVQNYTNLQWAIEQFAEDVHNFEQLLTRVDRTDPMALRMVNDQLLLLEKAFLDPTGLPSRPLKKHLIWAESSNDDYAGSSFPGLVDLLFGIEKMTSAEQQAQWEKVRHHFSLIVNAIQAAGFTLRDVINFVEEQY